MKINLSNFRIVVFTLLMLTFGVPEKMEAQRMPHGGAGMSRGGASRGGGGMSRPQSRPSRSSTPSRGSSSINGGAYRSPSRNQPSASRPSNQTATRPAENTASRPSTNNRGSAAQNSRDKGAGDRNVNRNDINIDRSRGDVNINVDNSKHVNVNNRNTVVRPAPRPYYRPPYRYGGFSFYCYHPYVYHPYHPYYWGPVWHPWGFFVATMATTAIIISIENQHYYYDQGVYYVESDGGYTVVQAPVGATVNTIPSESEQVVINETTTNYYYGGVYYEKDGEEYEVVAPTAGTVVENLPEGGEEVRVGDQTYVKYGETYYQPVQIDGKNKYEVVEVKEEDAE